MLFRSLLALVLVLVLVLVLEDDDEDDDEGEDKARRAIRQDSGRADYSPTLHTKRCH